jgi:NDP-sugar pyrophosphorylase family protein
MVYPNRIAVAHKKTWMDGTCVTVSESGQVNGFVMGDKNVTDQSTYKTVNIYSLSRDSWEKVSHRLDAVVSAGNVNNYYETIFSDLVDEGCLPLHKVSFDSKPWYEIDTIEDLREAEKLFPDSKPADSVKSPGRNPVLNVLNVASTAEAVSGI